MAGRDVISTVLQVQNKKEKQLVVEEELRNVKKRQLGVEQELTAMRSERDAANERVDRLATEMRNFQERFSGNRNTTAPPPLPRSSTWGT